MRKFWPALIASLAGIGFTGTQIVERIAILKDPDSTLFCDVNSVMSCSNVLEAWQSSVILGIPNAFIGAVMFSLFAATSLALVLGSYLSPAFLRSMNFLAVFFAAFATWFMIQTAFVIHALCLWCTGIITAVGVIGAVLTQHCAATGQYGMRAKSLSDAGVVHIAWAGWYAAILGLLYIGLAL
jgi:uncharacterized membrane protein